MFGTLTAAKLAATATLALAAAHAGHTGHPGNVPGTYTISTTIGSTSYCLDSNAQGAAYADPCNGGEYQEWYKTDIGDPGGPDYFHMFRDAATNLCLDSGNSGGVYALSCNGGTYQTWETQTNGAGSSHLQDLGSERWLVLDSTAALYTMPSESDASMWSFAGPS